MDEEFGGSSYQNIIYTNIRNFVFLAPMTYVVIGMNLPQPATGHIRSEIKRYIGGVNKALSSGIEHHTQAHFVHGVAEGHPLPWVSEPDMSPSSRPPESIFT